MLHCNGAGNLYIHCITKQAEREAQRRLNPSICYRYILFGKRKKMLQFGYV